MNRSISDTRSRGRKLVDTVAEALYDRKLVTERTARKRAHNMFKEGVEVGLRDGLTAVQSELNTVMRKRLSR